MRIRACLLMSGLLLFGCGKGESSPGESYSPELLTAYRRAIPASERLLAAEPGPEQTGALARRADTALAAYGIELVRAVNRPVRALVASLRAISDEPPSFFDAAERKFVWGPWANERGVGQVALYVAENPAGADFQYTYALLRTSDGELEGATPVILGGATPDANDPDRGVGVAVWDVEANHAFEVQHDGDAEASGRGRFVTLFGHDSVAEGDSAYNLAAFRNFVPDDAEAGSAEPADIDYFYGRFESAQGTRIDFVDSGLLANVCGASTDSCFSTPEATLPAIERFDYNAFFVDRGLGRAEAWLSEGDLLEEAHFVECWNPGIEQTSFQIEESGEMVETLENGSCTAPADQSARELGIPTLQDLDRNVLSLMSCAAENGAIGCP